MKQKKLLPAEYLRPRKSDTARTFAVRARRPPPPGCQVFDVQIVKKHGEVTAYAKHPETLEILGKVKAYPNGSYLSKRLLQVGWSSMIGAGEALNRTDYTDSSYSSYSYSPSAEAAEALRAAQLERKKKYLKKGYDTETAHAFSMHDFSGCGMGVRLYEALAAYACKHDMRMGSDQTLFPASRSFWEKQERKGRAFFDDEEKRFIVKNACAIRKTGLTGMKRKC